VFFIYRDSSLNILLQPSKWLFYCNYYAKKQTTFVSIPKINRTIKETNSLLTHRN